MGRLGAVHSWVSVHTKNRFKQLSSGDTLPLRQFLAPVEARLPIVKRFRKQLHTSFFFFPYSIFNLLLQPPIPFDQGPISIVVKPKRQVSDSFIDTSKREGCRE